MYRNLREYVSLLEQHGELVRITVPVDPELEMAEITDRMSKSPGGGKALLFENSGTAFPVVTNLFGSSRRIAMALGARSLDDIAGRIDDLISGAMSPMETISDKLRMLPLLAEASRWMPRRVRGRGECQQVVLTGEDASLGILPVLKCWPHDAGRFITLPLVHTADPGDGRRNVGMYRMQILSPHSTGMHWHIHKTGARHYDSYRKLGRRMPVSVALGGDPAYTYAATAPMPDGMDEYLLAGFLRRRSVRLVRCITNDLYVPADCDFVIEGYVDTAEAPVIEGPFGDHTGFYSLEDLYPVFHVTAITHCRNAIYPATVVGIPPQEDAYMAEATERIFLAPIRMALQSEVADLHMPVAGVAHNLAVVGVETRYAGQAVKVASGLWGAGQMMFCKCIVAVPPGTDLRDPQALAPLVKNMSPATDVHITHGVADVLDHATAVCGTGGKVVIDLTRYGGQAGVQAGPAKSRAEALLEAERRGYKLTVIDTPGGDGNQDAGSITEDWGIYTYFVDREADTGSAVDLAHILGVRIVVLFDPQAISLSPAELLWLAGGNTDPERDITILDGVMVVDARTKIPGSEGAPERWPNPVVSSPETIALVDKRMEEYGIGLQDSPSGRYARIVSTDNAQI